MSVERSTKPIGGEIKPKMSIVQRRQRVVLGNNPRKNLERLLISNGGSMEKVAEKLGVVPSTAYRWLRFLGAKKPPHRNFKDMAMLIPRH
jgi:DNA invertase Pin-like site-specific DNA recombinase